jgi:hypothetical protein
MIEDPSVQELVFEIEFGSEKEVALAKERINAIPDGKFLERIFQNILGQDLELKSKSIRALYYIALNSDHATCNILKRIENSLIRSPECNQAMKLDFLGID